MTELYMPIEARREVIKEYAAVWGCRTFVETGTSDGSTTAALRPFFDELFTIEIDPYLASVAAQRFQGDAKVCAMQGDSGVVVPIILAGLHHRAIFWLDGHWSGVGTNPDGPDTPVEDELAAILPDRHSHIILIDDARVFREGVDWEREKYNYPTLTWVRETAEAHGYAYELVDDIIRLTP